MRPLPGRTVVAEYGSKFEADVGHARLSDAGVESVVLGDPAHSVAPHHVTDRTFQLVVRDEMADHAREVLTDGLPADTDADELDEAFYERRFRDRPRWIRWMTIAVMAGLVTPLGLAAFLELLVLIDRAFP
jgi:hypothetical protein